eukprot:767532-Hanusia_phi.AAC.7
MMKYKEGNTNAKVEAWLKTYAQDPEMNPKIKSMVRKCASKKLERSHGKNWATYKASDSSRHDSGNPISANLGFHAWGSTILERSLSSSSSSQQSAGTSCSVQNNGLFDAFGEFVEYMGTLRIPRLFQDDMLALSSPARST